MQSRALIIWLAFSTILIGSSHAQEEPPDIPERAICVTCDAGGSSHGAEDVAAWREHDGEYYYFCSKNCAKRFDGFPAAFVPHPLPRPAPDVAFSTLDGEEYKLSDLKGKVVLLDFWATWCKPCHAVMPKLDELHTELSDRNFTVIGVSLDQDPEKVVSKFLKKKNYDYPIALDTGENPAWFSFYVAAIPAMFLIDEQGQIVREWKGDIDTKEVIKAVESVLSEAPPAD